MKIAIREGTDNDFPLILDSFVRTIAEAPQAQGATKWTLASLLEPLLHAPNWRIAIACPPDDLDTILGFCIWSPTQAANPTVAWVQVKAAWRQKGVGNALLVNAGVVLASPISLELITPFLVQRIGSDKNAPTITALAKAHNIILRFRPYIPLEVQRKAGLKALMESVKDQIPN